MSTICRCSKRCLYHVHALSHGILYYKSNTCAFELFLFEVLNIWSNGMVFLDITVSSSNLLVFTPDDFIISNQKQANRILMRPPCHDLQERLNVNNKMNARDTFLNIFSQPDKVVLNS